MRARWKTVPVVALLVACSGDKTELSGGGAAPSGGSRGASDTAESGTRGAGAGGAAALPEEDRRYLLSDEAGTVTFEDVEYAPDAVVVSGDARGALTDSDPKQHVYSFDAAAARRHGLALEKGKVLLIAGVALRRIAAVEESGGKVTVHTEKATLPEAIASGRIGWKLQLPLSGGHLVAFVDERGNELPSRRVRYASAGVHALPAPVLAGTFDFTHDGIDYKVELEPEGEKVALEVQAQRKLQRGGLVYKGKGTFPSVETVAEVVIERMKTERFDYHQDRLGGEIELSITAAGGGNNEIKVDVPGARFKWVTMAGPVPIVFTATVQIIGRVRVPAQASSSASAKFSFDGSANLEYRGGKVTAKASFGKEEFDPKPFDSASTIGSVVDSQFGVAFPKLQVGFFDSFFIPRFFAGAVLGVSLTWGPVCKQGYVKFVAGLGYDFEIFGVTLTSDEEIIYEKQRLAKQDGCE